MDGEYVGGDGSEGEGGSVKSLEPNRSVNLLRIIAHVSRYRLVSTVNPSGIATPCGERTGGRGLILNEITRMR